MAISLSSLLLAPRLFFWPGERALVDNLYNLNARGESLRQKEKRARARYPLGMIAARSQITPTVSLSFSLSLSLGPRA